MYFKVKWHKDENEEFKRTVGEARKTVAQIDDADLGISDFEQIIEAKSEAIARQQAEADGYICDNIEKNGFKELLQREKDRLINEAFHLYLRKFYDIPVKAFMKLREEFKQNPEMQFNALQFVNRRNAIIRAIVEKGYKADTRVVELFKVIDQLAAAESEEKFNKLYKQIEQA